MKKVITAIAILIATVGANAQSNRVKSDNLEKELMTLNKTNLSEKFAGYRMDQLDKETIRLIKEDGTARIYADVLNLSFNKKGDIYRVRLFNYDGSLEKEMSFLGWLMTANVNDVPVYTNNKSGAVWVNSINPNNKYLALEYFLAR